MTTPIVALGPGRLPRYAVGWLALSVLAVVAFVVVPPLVMPITREHPDLPSAAAEAFNAFWSNGIAEPGAEVQVMLHGWRDYHVAKALLALLCVVALVQLARTLPARRTVARGASLGLALMALLLVMANLQGALAPLAALLSLCPVSAMDPAAVAQLATDASGPQILPTTRVVVADFVLFHAVLATLTGVLGIGLLGSGIRHALRRQPGLRVVLPVVLGLAVLVIASANVSTVLDPVPALRSFLGGT